MSLEEKWLEASHEYDTAMRDAYGAESDSAKNDARATATSELRDLKRKADNAYRAYVLSMKSRPR